MSQAHYMCFVQGLQVLLYSGTASQHASYLLMFGVPIRYDAGGHWLDIV